MNKRNCIVVKDDNYENTEKIVILSDEMIDKYGIVIHDNLIEINQPTYINVVNPYVSIKERVYKIKNNKICVSLWINVLYMHVTVY